MPAFRSPVAVTHERGGEVAMTELGGDHIMLFFALTECRRALDNLADVDTLSNSRREDQPGMVTYENGAIFDKIRLGLQMAANVSRLFWSTRNLERSARLRELTGLPEAHGLRQRRLRNHIEHIDERLDIWTSAPRPFVGVELAIPADLDLPAAKKQEWTEAVAIMYDGKTQTVLLFGESYYLPDLRSYLEDALEKISQGLTAITSGPEWTSTTS